MSRVSLPHIDRSDDGLRFGVDAAAGKGGFWPMDRPWHGADLKED
jgi:hypothetical protein